MTRILCDAFSSSWGNQGVPTFFCKWVFQVTSIFFFWGVSASLLIKVPLTKHLSPWQRTDCWSLLLVDTFCRGFPSWLNFLSLVTRTRAVSWALREAGYFTLIAFPLTRERNGIGLILVGSSLSRCYLPGIQSFFLRLEVRLLSILGCFGFVPTI